MSVKSYSDEEDMPLSSLKTKGASKEKRPADDDDDDKPISSFKKKKPKVEVDSEDDKPLSRRNSAGSRRGSVTSKKPVVKTEDDDDDDKPLSSLGKGRKKTSAKKVKNEPDDDDFDDDKPLSSLKKKSSAKRKTSVKKSYKEENDDSDFDDDKPLSSLKKKKRTASSPKVAPKKIKKSSAKGTPTKKPVARGKNGTPIKVETEKQKARRLLKEKEEAERYKWWEESVDKVELEEGQRWKTLSHNTPLLAPEYEPLPKNVKFIYDGNKIDLSQDAEEVCGFYAAMINTDYAKNKVFINNFFKDWKTFMTKEEKALIKKFDLCDFSLIVSHFETQREIKKNFTKEQKQAIKKDKDKLIEIHGTAIVDGHKEKVGNFRIEPPGLFRGRGDHPKMGMVKRRVRAKDITINIGKGEKVPSPPEGEKWKDVICNDRVTWLATWQENIQGSIKYVMLNANSRMKGENDMKKYDKARDLKKCIGKIRKDYESDFKEKSMEFRQRATALYLIDRLALRVGNDKNTDEEADTVGCCSLRVEHLELEQPDIVKFDFLGKDSIRYQNSVPVPDQIFKNIKIFMKGKKKDDPIFDRLSVPALNKHLNGLMDGLTAKVFRTYNASFTLQEELNKVDVTNETLTLKIYSYNNANREVAILCNHQRAIPKSFDAQMEKLNAKVEEWEADKKKLIKERKACKAAKDTTGTTRLTKKIDTITERIEKKKTDIKSKDENKTVALGTSKINYMDPRITIAWCKRNEVPIEKCYSKTHREKFMWALPIEPEFQW